MLRVWILDTGFREFNPAIFIHQSDTPLGSNLASETYSRPNSFPINTSALDERKIIFVFAKFVILLDTADGSCDITINQRFILWIIVPRI